MIITSECKYRICIFEYNVGDSIAAYTTDHVSYSYYKYGILPDTEYTNNELMKVAGVLLGIGIFLLALFGVLSKKRRTAGL